MPAFVDLATLSSVILLIGLASSVSLVVLVADWRLAILVLVIHYILAAILLGSLVVFPIALVRIVSGALAALILYFTARQTQWRDRAAPVFIIGFTFRLFALALVAASIAGIASSMTFLSLAPSSLFGGLFLIAIGVLVAILSRDVLRLGVGILIFSSGFCIFETGIELSLFLYGLLNIADLLLAVVIAHLSKISRDEEWTDRRSESA